MKNIKITITSVICIVMGVHDCSLYTVSYLALYNLFRKKKTINTVRKKRTQLTVRVVVITMETRYKDALWRNIRNALGQDERHFHMFQGSRLIFNAVYRILVH